MVEGREKRQFSVRSADDALSQPGRRPLRGAGRPRRVRLRQVRGGTGRRVRGRRQRRRRRCSRGQRRRSGPPADQRGRQPQPLARSASRRCRRTGHAGGAGRRGASGRGGAVAACALRRQLRVGQRPPRAGRPGRLGDCARRGRCTGRTGRPRRGRQWRSTAGTPWSRGPAIRSESKPDECCEDVHPLRRRPARRSAAAAARGGRVRRSRPAGDRRRPGRGGAAAGERLEPVVLPDLAQVGDSVPRAGAGTLATGRAPAGRWGRLPPRARRRPTARSAWC